MGLLNKLGFGSNKPQETPATSPAAPPAAKMKKILVVEDDEALRNLYVEVLKAEQLEVISAENGLKGLEIAQAQRPDIILLDLMMPVMDGKTMLRTLRGLPGFEKLPVIILTNAGDIDSIRETKLFGNANAFLIKSNVTPQDIIQNVRTYV